MSHSPTIDEIRQRHDEVYGEILTDPSLAESGPRRDTFLAERVYPLLNDMKALSVGDMSVEDYGWLSDTAIQWQVVFSSIFNIPRTVQIASPRQLNPSEKRYSPDQLEDLLKRESFFLSQSRMLESLADYIRQYRSSPEEMKRDWHNAKVVLTFWLQEGVINFARQISPESYPYVEEVWLEELREATAYFHWLEGGKRPGTHAQDYDYATHHLREKLTEPHIKASYRDFTAVEKYLETHYLTDGMLDLSKEAAKELIERKARQLWIKTHASDEEENWLQARAYVEHFYEHIIPAAREDDEESIVAVLESFQVGEAPIYDALVNCFEVLIAIYFLDAEILTEQFAERVASTF